LKAVQTSISCHVGGLLDGLTSGVSGLFGDNSKLSTLLKAASALNKAKGVFDEVKQLAPKVHEHLQGSKYSN